MSQSKNNHLRYGGYASLLTLIIIAIAIVVNVLVTDLNIKIDTTTEGLYSLSENTQSVVKNLSDPINIYVLEETGKEQPGVKEILNKYNSLSDKLNIIYKDPILYPTFANTYKTDSSMRIEAGSIIIENTSTKKFKVIPPSQLFTTNTSDNTTTIKSIDIENVVTNGIGYVCLNVDGTVYYTIGHTENAIPENLKVCFKRSNLSLQELNLLTTEMPDPSSSILLIYSPHTDFTTEEITNITDFLDAGGKAMLFMDANMPELIEFNKLLNYYGIGHDEGVIVEADQAHTAVSNPNYLLPNMIKHDITNSLNSNSLPVVIPFASGIKCVESPRNGVNLIPLLSSSEDSYLKKNINFTTYEFEDGDTIGPVVLACAIEENNTIDAEHPINTRLFVMSDTFFMEDSILSKGNLSVGVTGNQELITNACGWLQNIDATYAIENKTVDKYNLRPISSSEVIIYGVLTIALIPLLITVIGIVVWVKRRHL